MSDTQRIETEVLYILVGVDMRINAVLEQLLVVIMKVCLMSVLAASILLGMVGLLNLCIENKQFIINRCCIFV